MRQSSNLEVVTPQKTVRQRRQADNTPEEVIQTSFRLPRSRWKKLQELSIDQRASVQSIIITALEAEFAKRGIRF